MLLEDMISKSKVALVAMIIGTMTAASTLFNNVHAAPTTVVSGRGTGTFTCGDGTQVNTVFNLSVQKVKSKDSGTSFKLFGFWDVSIPNFQTIASGSVYSGKVGKTSYSVLAIEFQGSQCPGNDTPAKGTITGNCGQDAQVQLRFENGDHGTFTGNFVCF